MNLYKDLNIEKPLLIQEGGEEGTKKSSTWKYGLGALLAGGVVLTVILVATGGGPNKSFGFYVDKDFKVKS